MTSASLGVVYSRLIYLLGTNLVFLDSGQKLVSSSEDIFLRVWNLEIEDFSCVQIVSGNHNEIWSIEVVPDKIFLASGSPYIELRFYTIKHDSWMNNYCLFAFTLL